MKNTTGLIILSLISILVLALVVNLVWNANWNLDHLMNGKLEKVQIVNEDFIGNIKTFDITDPATIKHMESIFFGKLGFGGVEAIGLGLKVRFIYEGKAIEMGIWFKSDAQDEFIYYDRNLKYRLSDSESHYLYQLIEPLLQSN